jgi:hypothetical protein
VKYYTGVPWVVQLELHKPFVSALCTAVSGNTFVHCNILFSKNETEYRSGSKAERE